MNEKYNEAMITLTSYPEWSDLVKELENIIYQVQANSLEATSWDALCENKGFARGLAYITNLRETIKQQAKIEADNAQL